MNERGVIKTLKGTGTNASIAITVPVSRAWELLFGQIAFIADATVATRYVRLEVQEKTTAAVLFRSSSLTMTASQTGMITFGGVTNFAALATQFMVDAKGGPLAMSEDTINIVVSGAVAGDSFTANLRVRETFRPQPQPTTFP